MRAIAAAILTGSWVIGFSVQWATGALHDGTLPSLLAAGFSGFGTGTVIHLIMTGK